MVDLRDFAGGAKQDISKKVTGTTATGPLGTQIHWQRYVFGPGIAGARVRASIASAFMGILYLPDAFLNIA